MLGIFKAAVCLFKGHDVNTNESLIGDVMFDPRNWICRCHRCGYYIMHEGVYGEGEVMLSRKAALNEALEIWHVSKQLEGAFSRGWGEGDGGD